MYKTSHLVLVFLLGIFLGVVFTFTTDANAQSLPEQINPGIVNYNFGVSAWTIEGGRLVRSWDFFDEAPCYDPAYTQLFFVTSEGYTSVGGGTDASGSCPSKTAPRIATNSQITSVANWNTGIPTSTPGYLVWLYGEAGLGSAYDQAVASSTGYVMWYYNGNDDKYDPENWSLSDGGYIPDENTSTVILDITSPVHGDYFSTSSIPLEMEVRIGDDFFPNQIYWEGKFTNRRTGVVEHVLGGEVPEDGMLSITLGEFPFDPFEEGQYSSEFTIHTEACIGIIDVECHYSQIDKWPLPLYFNVGISTSSWPIPNFQEGAFNPDLVISTSTESTSLPDWLSSILNVDTALSNKHPWAWAIDFGQILYTSTTRPPENVSAPLLILDFAISNSTSSMFYVDVDTSSMEMEVFSSSTVSELMPVDTIRELIRFALWLLFMFYLWRTIQSIFNRA